MIAGATSAHGSRRAAWWLVTVLATLTGAFSLRYALPHVPMVTLSNFVTHRATLSVHAVSSSVALIVGPWQFRSSLRIGHLRMHRLLGRIYTGAVLAGWLASIPIALHAETGPVASAGFLALGICWIVSTGLAVSCVLQGDVAGHRLWMIRSYALTAAAITLRLYLGIVIMEHMSFAPAYTAIAWLCWIPNLAAVEIASWRSTHVARRSVGSRTTPT